MLPGTIPSPGGHARPAKPGAGIQFPSTNGNAATLLPPDGPEADYSIRMPSALPSSGTQYPGYDSAGNFVAWASMPASVTDHGELTGLADDDHPQYVSLAGRAGGQAIQGETTIGTTVFRDSGDTIENKAVNTTVWLTGANGSIQAGEDGSGRPAIYIRATNNLPAFNLTANGFVGWNSSETSTTYNVPTRLGLAANRVLQIYDSIGNSGGSGFRLSYVRLIPYSNSNRPAASGEPKLIYNSDTGALQYSDGTQWRALDGTIV